MSIYPTNTELLKNRDPGSALGPFDGKVAAVALVGGEHYVITTNTDYIPALSVEVPHRVFMRSDMQYGTDDPTPWPKEWTRTYCHMPAIAAKGSHPELRIMWWDPSPSSFIVASTITRSLGRLHPRHVSELLFPINDLIRQCKLFPADTPVAQCVGAFTISPTIAQQLCAARLPFWFMRPTHAFDGPLTEPVLLAPAVEDTVGDTPPALYSGNKTG
ncbi:hypothetical protein K438DRAFT_1755984 [Mycena galopus ATCC 62051]|nr:hypothetical protein K438DRAFT_1755984 [Mycena galopus ATCC 62051]